MNEPSPPSPPRTQRPPPEAWAGARNAAKRLLGPLDRFLHIEASSGIVLLLATGSALLCANSGLRGFYDRLWHIPVRMGMSSWTFERPLHFWINDGLMVLFFFVVGLEVRREMHDGQLNGLRRASLPLAAALGGMVAPAALFAIVNHGKPAQGAWGVPMATDIAFGVGVLALMGNRVPSPVRVLLLALAVIDDIGAILVIAIFYATGFSWWGMGIAAAGALFVIALRGLGVRRASAYVLPGLVMWAGCLKAGVHPTIAGVILGLMTPVRTWYDEGDFLAAAARAIDRFRLRMEGMHAPHDLVTPLVDLGEARREVLSPAARLEGYLHPWVSFGILPLFAFANAGVNLGGIDFTVEGATSVVTGVTLGLLAGKPLGILLACWIAIATRLSAPPQGIGWKGITLVGLVAGIGFTMAIFIAGLALEDAMLAVAKLAILAASVLAGIAALIFGRFAFAAPPGQASPPT